MAERNSPEAPENRGFLNIALPKGRLGDKAYQLFADAGYPCPAVLDPTRKLIFENSDAGVRYFWVKPSDVGIYVERGAADIGVVGKDILLEYPAEVYELLDLGIGRCRMMVAAPSGFRDNFERTLRVATTFPRIAGQYYGGQSRDIDIIQLKGSMEIAPILGLSDVIVDLVETGNTLRENDLRPTETIVEVSARLIANKASFKFADERIQDLKERLQLRLPKGE
jgi:ATP phosphoribosyltransferase